MNIIEYGEIRDNSNYDIDKQSIKSKMTIAEQLVLKMRSADPRQQ